MFTSAQELFDASARHILRQGKPALNREGKCRYRTTDGLRCGIGGLIPDDRYDSSFESYSVCWYTTQHDRPILDAAGIPHALDRLAADMQHVHDDAAMSWQEDFLPAYKRLMTSLAHSYALSPAVLT